MDDPRKILDMRLAKGEITVEEHRNLLTAVSSADALPALAGTGGSVEPPVKSDWSNGWSNLKWGAGLLSVLAALYLWQTSTCPPGQACHFVPKEPGFLMLALGLVLTAVGVIQILSKR